MEILLVAYLTFALSALAHSVFLVVAIVVAVRAAHTATRARYLPALFWGLIGHALVPLIWALTYSVGSGPPRLVQTFLSDAPLSLVNGMLNAVAPFAPKLNIFLTSTASLGFHVGLFATLYLLSHRR